MTTLCKVMKYVGIILMTACLAWGIISLINGNMHSVLLMALLAMLNFISVVVFVALEDES